MPQWNIIISGKTDQKVRTYLTHRGLKKSDLSKFVEESVRKEILRDTIRAVHEQNVGISEQEAMDLANEAVNWARANRL